MKYNMARAPPDARGTLVYLRHRHTPDGIHAQKILEDANIPFYTTTEALHPYRGLPPSATPILDGCTRDFSQYVERDSHPSIMVTNQFFSGVNEISFFASLYPTICDVAYLVATKRDLLQRRKPHPPDLCLNERECKSVVDLALANVMLVLPAQIPANTPLVDVCPAFYSPDIVDVARFVTDTLELAGYSFAPSQHPIRLLHEYAIGRAIHTHNEDRQLRARDFYGGLRDIVLNAVGEDV